MKCLIQRIQRLLTICAVDNMKYAKTIKLRGVTLFEMLLVLVIITSVILMLITYTTTKTTETKRDRMVMQVTQVLNAALAYYINKSRWPGSLSDLQTDGYLPSGINIINPYGSGFAFANKSDTGVFSVCSDLPATPKNVTNAKIIAGRVPMGFVTIAPCASASGSFATGCTTSCAVVASVNIPGQNLNNARSVNFTGIYHNGACVPAPYCPTNMTAAIIVAPVQVSGTYDGGGAGIVYPLNSFSAYAVGTSASNSKPSTSPGKCTNANDTSAGCDFTDGGPNVAGLLYWRVCLNVVTARGPISGSTWDDTSGTVMAITRCVPSGEPIGSGFTVFRRD
jgi:competence protein ComGC